jgi:hypothetical protein
VSDWIRLTPSVLRDGGGWYEGLLGKRQPLRSRGCGFCMFGAAAKGTRVLNRGCSWQADVGTCYSTGRFVHVLHVATGAQGGGLVAAS